MIGPETLNSFVFNITLGFTMMYIIISILVGKPKKRRLI